MPSISWQPWSRAAFDRARAERKPVLLSIVTAWCRGCEEMDRSSYADERVAAIVTDLFVPVRVNADQRPDIASRYGLGAYPTTAFLTSDGVLAGGGTHAAADRLYATLERVALTFEERQADLSRAMPPAHLAMRHAADGDPVSAVIASFDPEAGVFGGQPNFPHVAPVRFALEQFARTSDASMRDMAVTSLDAMGWGGLYDEVDGGFFRCAARRDWQEPTLEKLLDVNAALLDLYVSASEVLGFSRYRERAEDILRFTQTWLADAVDGGWAGSLHADGHYYSAQTHEERTARPRPPTDRVLYTEWNASMASAALHAAAAFEDTSLRDFALTSLERVSLLCYRPGGGMAHYYDGDAHVRGLLADQVTAAIAHLDAYDTTGNIVYEMMAEELAHYAIRTMWDEGEGGFFDRIAEADAVGLLAAPLKPFVSNCDAVRMLHRVAAVSGDSAFVSYADRTLAVLEPLAAAQGPLAAHYLLARAFR